MMTRACNSTRPRSPKSATATGAQPFRMSKDRGVTKKTVNQPRLKAISKSHSKDECLALLKNLLPSSNQEQPVSELALVEQTIAYIAYLEQMLQQPDTEQAGCDVSTTILMLQNMRFKT